MTTFREKVERLQSAISKAEMFVNRGGDPKSVEAGPIRAEVVEAWKEFAGEFAQGSPESQN